MQILVLEDEALIAIDLLDCLEEAGFKVLLAPTLEVAEQLLFHGKIDAGIIDLSYPAAELDKFLLNLDSRGVPYVIFSGESINLSDKKVDPSRVWLQKPATAEQIILAVNQLIGPAPI